MSFRDHCRGCAIVQSSPGRVSLTRRWRAKMQALRIQRCATLNHRVVYFACGI